MSGRLAFAIAAFMTCAPTPAGAHAFDPIVVELRDGSGGAVELAWRVPPGVAARGDQVLAPLIPASCRITARPSLVAWRLDCGAAGLRGASFGFAGLDGAQAEALVHVFFVDGSETVGVLRGDADRFTIPGGGGRPGAGAIVTGYLRLGVAHILGGADHLLLLAGLLLLVRGTRPLVRAVTAFTVAHSVTLALAGTGALVLPPPPVEALIAASILLVALELARARDPDAAPSLLARAPAVAALAFGLLHGLGFAAALAEAGLPPERAPLALLSFNLGVELGQLLVIAALLAPARWWRARAREDLLRHAPVYALGAVAAAWLIARTGAVFSTEGIG